MFTSEKKASIRADMAICKAVLEGNTDAFSILVKENQTAVYRLGMSFFKNADDAKDFVQEVMIKAYSSLAQFKGKARFSTWLISIAYHHGINSVQKSKKYISLAEEAEFISPDASPEQYHMLECVKCSVNDAIANLSEKYKICVDFYFFYNMSYKDVASVTGLPLNTVKSHIFRAKKILKDYLKETQLAFLSLPRWHHEAFRVIVGSI